MSWLSTAQVMFRKWGGGFDFYTAISTCLLKIRTPCWDPGTNTPNPKALWATAVSFHEPQQPPLRGVVHSSAAGMVCPFAFFLSLCRLTVVCRAAALWVCGGGRGSEELKSSHVPQEARDLQSCFPCWLLHSLKMKRVEELFLLTLEWAWRSRNSGDHTHITNTLLVFL